MVRIIIEIDGEDVKVVTDTKDTEEAKKSTEEVVNCENSCSQYARFFDDGCVSWSKDSEVNRIFLKTQQDYANEKLRTKGHLFLNEVYDLLGMPRSKAGCVVGWIYDEEHPIGDNCVDFGIYDYTNDKNRDFVNGYANTVLLDFNVDGDITNLI